MTVFGKATHVSRSGLLISPTVDAVSSWSSCTRVNKNTWMNLDIHKTMGCIWTHAWLSQLDTFKSNKVINVIGNIVSWIEQGISTIWILGLEHMMCTVAVRSKTHHISETRWLRATSHTNVVRCSNVHMLLLVHPIIFSKNEMSLDEKSSSLWQLLQHHKSRMPNFLHEMTNNVRVMV